MLGRSPKLDPAFVRMLEYSEADAWRDFYAAAGDAAGTFGVEFERLGAVRVSIVAGVDLLLFNRVLGIGLSEPAAAEVIDEIVALYREAGVPRFTVQLSPFATPAEIPFWLEERGFERRHDWVKLTRGEVAMPVIASGLRVEPIEDERGSEAFAAISTTAFEWPDALRPWIVRCVGRPGWRHYLAFDEGIAVAGGAIYVRDRCAWLGFACTTPAYRKRGAQSLLIARAVSEAASLGCTQLVLETSEGSPTHGNAIRYGFRAAYRRPNYIYRFAEAAG